MRSFTFCVFLSLHYLTSTAQTIGGNSAFNFLKLPVSAQSSALGGINTSNLSKDAGLVYSNPALLRDSLDARISANFNLMYAGIKDYFIIGVTHLKKSNLNFAAAVNFISYGSVVQTDLSGNQIGNFSPTDYDIQISASKKYESNWYYGAAIKFIHSGCI